MKKYLLLLPLSLILLFSSCNKNEEIVEERILPPVIELDSENGIYTIKVGRELTINPTYTNTEDALYVWTADGKLISSDPVLHYSWDEPKEVFVKLRVDTNGGHAEEEIKVTVMDLTPPLISLVIPSKGLKVMQNTDYVIAPDIQHDDLEAFNIEWIRNGEVVGKEKAYTFNESELGTYRIRIKASNIDGETIRDIDIEVVDTMPYSVTFPTPSYNQTGTDRFTFPGRPVYLRPLLDYFDHPQFEWKVNGVVIDSETERIFKFTPETSGTYIISLKVTEETATPSRLTRNITQANSSLTERVRVTCVAEEESDRYRPVTDSSSRLWNKVYEYTPAPGQFINETASGGFTGSEVTPEAAVEYATNRLDKKQYVSLGSWGGYIIVGFDHSIKSGDGEYDFAIQGNSFEGSSEPGIVWVMQDTNGNGLPDDEWYELRGSETGKTETIQNYELTYYRPDNPKSKVIWVDYLGEKGWVDYLSAFHFQDYYYPLWIREDSYTFTGTLLKPRNRQDPSTGFWSNDAYAWGYADNFGDDQLAGGDLVDGSGQCNGFKISNAMHIDGTPVNLQYIDFIKVQCGVLAKSGWLGEISTEVFSFEDLTIKSNE